MGAGSSRRCRRPPSRESWRTSFRSIDRRPVGQIGRSLRIRQEFSRAPRIERRMKIYTKTGDAGQTSLYGGQRVSKDDLRVWTYGTIDECNAVLGLALSDVNDAEAAE